MVGQRQIFEKPFMAILFTHKVFARKLLRENRRRNVHIFGDLSVFRPKSNESFFSTHKYTHEILNINLPTLIPVACSVVPFITQGKQSDECT